MIFPRYPAYKDSGVEWLGDMPEHWEARPIKTVAHIENSGFYGEDEDVHPLRVPVATTAQIDRDGRFSVEEMPIRSFTNDERNRYGCRSGDILVVKSSGSATNIISGKAGLVREADPLFIFSNFLMRIQVDRKASTPAFLYYFITSNITKQRVQLMCSSTTYPNLKVGEYISACISLPSVNEQVQIATFLDRETTKIDALIAEQKHLIELLQEKRQAVISHAVTKGLNPNAPMKDSEVEWLGEVPEHWEVKTIRMVTERITYGFTNPMPTEEIGPYMLTANDIDNGRIRFESCRRTSDYAFCSELTAKSRPVDGDILLTKDGTLGRVALYAEQDEPACINQSVALLRPNTRMCSGAFLAAALMSANYQEKMLFDAGGTTIKHIYISRLAKMAVALPPAQEQEEILVGLRNETRPYELLVAESNASLILLKERRSALISAAVTGQIDVRGMVTEAIEL